MADCDGNVVAMDASAAAAAVNFFGEWKKWNCGGDVAVRGNQPKCRRDVWSVKI